MKRLHSLLTFLRVEDDDGVVSITNMACWTVLGLLAVCAFKTGTLDLPGVGALIAALAHYTAKKVIAGKVDDTAEQVKEALSKASVAHDALNSTAIELKSLKDRLVAVDNRTRPIR